MHRAGAIPWPSAEFTENVLVQEYMDCPSMALVDYSGFDSVCLSFLNDCEVRNRIFPISIFQRQSCSKTVSNKNKITLIQKWEKCSTSVFFHTIFHLIHKCFTVDMFLFSWLEPMENRLPDHGNIRFIINLAVYFATDFVIFYDRPVSSQDNRTQCLRIFNT